MGKFLTKDKIQSNNLRTNYIRIAFGSKGAYMLAGVLSNDRALTRIPITPDNIIKGITYYLD